MRLLGVIIMLCSVLQSDPNEASERLLVVIDDAIENLNCQSRTTRATTAQKLLGVAIHCAMLMARIFQTRCDWCVDDHVYFAPPIASMG
jgi:hypothetical protein